MSIDFRVIGDVSAPSRGMDSAIAHVPDGLYVDFHGERTLVVTRLNMVLRELSEVAAANINEKLHHAVWIITGDPEQVRTRGLAHDCATCRASVDQALTFLRENRGAELLVGTLYWA